MQGHRFHGLELPVRATSGARAMRVVHPADQRIGAHRHDWPLLTIPAIGGYSEECDEGVVRLDGPAVILHPPGCCHANCIHKSGMETFSIEFDPDWLGLRKGGVRIDRSHYWRGGQVALSARRLARLWSAGSPATDQLRSATAAFVASALRQRAAAAPPWFATLSAWLDQPRVTATGELARRLGLHPAWLARAYREAAGEGLQETVRRKRLERAIALLRGTDEPIAGVAAAAGFCDQSHLNRVARELTGRTPVQLRAERAVLRALGSA